MNKMSETGVVVNGDPHVSLLDGPIFNSSSTTDVDDIILGSNEVTRNNAWIKPQISIESVDDSVGNKHDSSSIQPLNLRGLEDSGSTTDKNPTLIRVQQTRVYPKTPPPNYKYHSSSKGSRENSNGRKEEGSCEDIRDEEGAGTTTTRRESTDSNSLQVKYSNETRSLSLPMGLKLTGKDLHCISSNSDETIDSELGSPKEKHKRMRHLDLLHQERLDSVGSNFSSPETTDDSSSDGAGDEDKMASDIATSGLEQEDEIFMDVESDMQEKAETKLIHWACNDFVPACHQLLSRCSEREKNALKKSADIQADLRSLSNTITFFCSEQQQRLSQVIDLPPLKSRGKSHSSTNTRTFPRPPRDFITGDTGGDKSYAVKVLRSASQSLIQPLLVQASSKDGFTPNLHQAIIKALQKIAWKVEACASFSNPNHSVDIHKKIFDAKHSENVRDLMIQALPPAEPNLRTVQPYHHRERKGSLPASVMVDPPVVPMRRGQSVRGKLGGEVAQNDEATPSPDLQSIGEHDSDEDDEVWRDNDDKEEEEEEEEREQKKSKSVEPEDNDDIQLNFSVEPQSLEDVAEEEVEKEEEEEEEEKLGLEVHRNPLLSKERSQKSTPILLRRERFATEGEADIKSPQLKKGGSIPNLDHEDNDTMNDSGASVKSERYFRPKAFRRTTVSLSRREVQTLGLTVAKRVDETILDDIRVQREKEEAHRRSCRRNKKGSRSEEKPSRIVEEERVPGQILELEARDPQPENYGIDNPEDLDKVGNKLHNTLTKRFDRYRSVSLSDMLDQDDESISNACSTPDPSNSDRDSDVLSPQPNQRLELVPTEKRPLFRNASANPSSASSSSSQPVSPNYLPMRTATLIPSSSSNGMSDWVLVEGEKHKKTSVRGRAKATVKKSLSSSGRLAHRLIKTGLSLRSSSTNTKPISKSLSAADLLDQSTMIHQQSGVTDSVPARMSMSITPSSPNYDMSTLPNRNKRKNTIAKFMRRGKDIRSRSFNKSDKYSVGSYQTWHQEDLNGGDRALAESIESVSRNAIRSVAFNDEEQLLISVDMASKKLRRKQGLHNGSSLGRESSNPWFQITVHTNIRLFGRQNYTILRPFKDIQKLIDGLSSHGAVDVQIPRPDKKSGAKKQMKGMEDILRSIAGNPHLRSSQAFVTFLRPDDQFGNFTENDHSEVNFERLMTFYTPTLSSGPPGSFPSVQTVPAEYVPTEQPDYPRKSSLTSGHKKGSMHYMKKDGKEDTSTFVIQEEGEDALIVACEDDHYVVVAGTFEKLVEQLACEEKPDARFVSTFLLGYRHFATTMDFLTKLLERFHMKLPPSPTDEEMAYAEKWSYVIQLRVLDILTYWIKKCWPGVYRHPPVLEKLREFAASLRATDDHNFQYAGTNVDKIIKEKIATSSHFCLPADMLAVDSPPPSSAFTSTHPPTTSPSRDHTYQLTSPRGSGSGSPLHHPTTLIKRSSAGSSSRSISISPVHRIRSDGGGSHLSSSGSYSSVDVCSIPSIQLARQLTLLELEFLRAIDVHELVVFTWDPNTPENKPYRRNLDAFIERFNKVSYWVASEICCVEEVRLRGILLEKFIEVAKYCHEFKNYNTAISILSGLSLAAVRRLKRSWELVNEKTRKWFTKLQPLTSPATNHSNYRRALATVHRRDPCIPYLGVFMRDLTFFNDGNNKKLKNGLYNFSKLRTMVYKFEELKRYQRSKYIFTPEEKIREFCRNLWCLSEQELYETSLRREPRQETPREETDL